MSGRRLFQFLMLFMCSLLAAHSADAQELQLKDAFQKIEAAALAHPDDLNAQMDLAYVYSEGLAIQKAIDIYEKIIKIDAQNVRAATELCVLYTRLQDKDRAFASCAKTVDIDGANYLAWDNLGLCHLKFSDAAGSFRPFLHALALQKDASLVKNHLAQVYLVLHEFRLAEGIFRELIASPGVAREEQAFFHHGLYLALSGQKRYAEAYAEIRETNRVSDNPLFFGKVVSAFIAAHQMVFFLLLCTIMLLASRYFGERLNRFLKNE